MINYLVVGIGGLVGSCLRYAFNRMTAGAAFFPFGTLISNVVAGLVIGFIIGLGQSTLSPRARLLLTTGFCGGLSTFSTFSLETIELFQAGKYLLSVSNVLLNLALSLAGVMLGLAMAKLVLNKA